MLASVRVLRHGLRLGVHNFWPTRDGGSVAIGKRVVLRREPDAAEFGVAGILRVGNKPGFHALCADGDGDLFYGEYCLNNDRCQAIGVFRSCDEGRSWQLAFEFAPGEVRHIHLIQWDPYERCLWMGTGDRGPECRLLKSTTKGATWQCVGQGSQDWRVVALVFRPEAVYWGTDAGGPDAGTDAARIMRLDRQTGKEQFLLEVQGPCHGACSLSDGTILISTGIEGGANERDGRAHLWASRDGAQWSDLGSWRKDSWPYPLQFGVLRFPHNIESVDTVHLTAFGLEGMGETYLCGRILP